MGIIKRLGRGRLQMNVDQAARTRVLAPFLAFVAMLALCLACFPGIALAVCPKPGSEAAISDRGCPSQIGELVTLDDINASHPTPEGGSGSDGLHAQELKPGQKTLPLLVIVIGFDGTPYRDDYDWANAMFEEEYSLATYYTDMSLGQFTFEPMNETSAYGDGGNTNQADRAYDGIVHVTLETPHHDWSDLNSKEMDTLGPALLEALREADPYVDFASYDTDGDGSLQNNEMALGFIIAGYEAANGTYDHSEYGLDNYFWSHAFYITASLEQAGLYSPETYYRPDSVMVSQYIAIAEQGSPGVQNSIGALAHELGHYLGLPDLYDTLYSDKNAWSEYDVGGLCLMDAGSWARTKDGRSIPTALSAPCRGLLGWMDAIAMNDGDSLLISPQDFSSPPEDSGYICAYIGVDERDDEFYLVENRRYRKWDEALWADYGSYDTSGGLVIWHVDFDTIEKHRANYSVNNSDHHPGIMPFFFEVDANYDIFVIGDEPYIDMPFFDAWKWNHFYADALGECLTLPQYGTDPDNDVPSARTLSSSRVYFAEAENDDVLIGLGAEPCNHDLEHCKAVAPTCDSDGVVEHWKCTKCGRLFSDAEARHSMGESDIVAPALGHDLVGHKAVEPTCEAPGARAYWSCARCAKVFSDSKGERETKLTQVTRNAKGHAWGGWQVTKPATCTEDGVETRACANDAHHTETRTLEATGHAWNAGAVTKAATYDAAGVRTYTCGKCKGTRTEPIPKLARTSLSKATISVPPKAAYTGKKIAPDPVVVVGGKTLAKGTDYAVSYSANVNVGKVTVTVTGKGAYAGSKEAAFTITQAANKATAAKTSVSKTVKLANLKKKAQTVALPKVTAKFGNTKWKVTVKDKKGILSLKNGKIQVKKGAKVGTYTIKLKASVAKTKNYKAATTKTVTVNVTVSSGKAKSSSALTTAKV